MTVPRLMLFGAPGQLGQAFQYVRDHAPVKLNWEVGLFGRQECDLTNAQEIKTVIHNFRPDLIVNAGAITNVDQAEANETMAAVVNFHAPANMAAQCASLDIPMIQLSTDYVFDGTKTTPYLPDDQMNPLNYYGASKMMGEEAVRQELAWHVILRVSSVFSAFRRNILTSTINMIESQDELHMVTDMVSAPTPATHIVSAVLTIAGQLLGGKTDGFGLFQLCGAPACSRYEFAQAIMDAYAPHTTKRPKITPTTFASFPNAAKRPLYTVMDCAKIKDVYGIAQRPWQEGLDEAMNILFKGGRTRL